jgi:hypothetical protein
MNVIIGTSRGRPPARDLPELGNVIERGALNGGAEYRPGQTREDQRRSFSSQGVKTGRGQFIIKFRQETPN